MTLSMLTDEAWKRWLLIILLVGVLFAINAPIGTIAAVIVIVGAIASYMDLI